MSRVELVISSGLRLHFDLKVGYDAVYFPAKLRNKDKAILHLLNGLKWKITFPEEDYLSDRMVTLEAIDPDEDIVKALRALMNIRGLRREEVERLKKLPTKEVCRELALKFLIS
jgi:hypothetical protein